MNVLHNYCIKYIFKPTTMLIASPRDAPGALHCWRCLMKLLTLSLDPTGRTNVVRSKHSSTNNSAESYISCMISVRGSVANYLLSLRGLTAMAEMSEGRQRCTVRFWQSELVLRNHEHMRGSNQLPAICLHRIECKAK